MKNILRKVKILERMILCYISYKLGIPRPFSCGFGITNDCNLTCSFCPFFGENRKFRHTSRISKQKYEMTTEEAKYVIDQIEKLGVVYLSFDGGEPLIRSDLKELAQYARKKNMIINLTTNGTLATKELAQSLNGCFDNICVSIHGLGDLDDKMKGQKGAFKKSVKGLEFLKKYSGARMGINFVINKYNYHQIEDVLNFAKKNCDFVNYLPVNFFPGFFLNKKTAQEIENKLTELKEKNETFITHTKDYLQLFVKHLEGNKVPVKCIAFDLTLSVGADGELGGCCYPFTVGNILKTDAKTLLRLGKSKKKELQKRCGGSVIAGCGEYPKFLEQFILKSLLNIPMFLKKSLFG